MTQQPYRDAAPATSVTPRVGFAITVLTVINLFNYLDRYVLPSVLSPIERSLGLGHAQAGVLGSAFVIVYMAASPVFGRLGDRRSRRSLIAVGIALWSLASAASGITRSFVSLLAARSAVGIGEAAYATIAPSLISDFAPAERRGRIMAIFFAAIPLGSALGFVLGGLGAQWLGWRSTFFVTGLPGLLLAAMAMRMPEPVRGAFDEPGSAEAPPWREALGVLGRSRDYVWAVAGYTAVTFGLGGLSFWMPLYLHEVRGVAVGSAGVLVGGVTVVAGLLGTVAGGWLGERLRGRIRGAYLAVCAVGGIVSCVCALALFRVASLHVMYALLFLSVFFVFVPNGPVNTILVNSVPAGVRATASAVAIFCIHFFGDAGSPLLIGAVASASSLRTAVLLVPLTLGLGGVLWWIGRLERQPGHGS